MSIRKKKYKKLLQEIKYLRSDIEYQEEVLREYHTIFDEYYRAFCAENNVDIIEQEENNKEKIDSLFPGLSKSCNQKHDNSGKIIPEEDLETKLDAKKLNKLYKKLAMETHPDKETGDAKKFSNINGAYKNGDWSILIEYAVEMDIELENLGQINSLLEKEVKKARLKSISNKGMYSWRFYLCEENKKCKDNLVKKFIKQIFNLEVK